MRIRFFIISSFAAIIILGMILIYSWINRDIRPGYSKIIEEGLVDTSRILSAVLGEAAEAGYDPVTLLEKACGERLENEHFSARIHDLVKREVDLEVYLTDATGKVIFHSENPEQVGLDYSRWNDVKRVLQGAYGARATRLDPDDPDSSRYHIAAPVTVGGELIGVVTVIKPLSVAGILVSQVRLRLIIGAVLISVLMILVALLASAWITQPLESLTRFARDVAGNKRSVLPAESSFHEVTVLREALQNMREALDGRRYAEQYVETFTHEIKSPVSAIKGALELLQEPMEKEEQRRFLDNIEFETARISRITDRLLQLSSLERMQMLSSIEKIEVAPLLEEITRHFFGQAKLRRIYFTVEMKGQFCIQGDLFLLKQALLNVVQNALDFSSDEGTIAIEVSKVGDGEHLQFRISDEGPGIPDYAMARVFDRFYSLPRPATGRKSSGLGLSFVREVCSLHQGRVSIERKEKRGTTVVVEIPVRLDAG